MRWRKYATVYETSAQTEAVVYLAGGGDAIDESKLGASVEQHVEEQKAPVLDGVIFEENPDDAEWALHAVP